MNLIYQLGIQFYRFAANVASFFNEKARLWRSGQQSVFPYLKEHLKSDNSPLVWVHCASLGEFEQGRPLIESIKKELPHYKILLTFFSPSGYEVRKDYEQADYICYLPIDTRANARKFLDLVKPELAFFIKYEFWKNYMDELFARDVPLYLVSVIFRPDQLFFKNNFRAKWYRSLLDKVEYFFVQNKQSADLLSKINLNNYSITGDTRFDRVAEIASNPKKLDLIQQFKGDSVLVVAGSSWEPDEKILAEYLVHNKSVKMIFAPHEVKEANIKRLIVSLPEDAVRFSQANNNIQDFRILVIDSIGILSSVYQYADVAYIGGGFGVGIHNTLEAAIYNVPVLFGPKYLKFQEAVELVNRKLAFSVSDFSELRLCLDDLIKDHKKLKEIELGCDCFIRENLGSTASIMKKVFNK